VSVRLRAGLSETQRTHTIALIRRAVAMSQWQPQHGASYLVTGEPAVVMVHTTPGTANALGGLMNAFRSNVPLVLCAGRTPLSEAGMPGSRDTLIHWGQESFDQGGIVREFVKWDYELRNFAQLEAVMRRAFAVAMADAQKNANDHTILWLQIQQAWLHMNAQDFTGALANCQSAIARLSDRTPRAAPAGAAGPAQRAGCRSAPPRPSRPFRFQAPAFSPFMECLGQSAVNPAAATIRSARLAGR